MARRAYPFAINKASPQWQGLVAWCPLGTGSLHHDLAGRGTTPTSVNGPVLGGVPDHGAVMNFTASSDQYINLGNPAALQITGDITVCCWYRVASVPANTSGVMLVAKDKDSGGRAYTMDLYRDDTLGDRGVRFYINGGAGGAIIEDGSNPVAGDVKHAVGRYKIGDGAFADLTVFINGRLADNVTLGTGPIDTATANVLIGRREYSGFEQPFDGSIWDVRIYNRALTDAEIWALYDPATRWELYNPAIKRRRDVPAAAAGGGKTMFWYASYGQCA